MTIINTNDIQYEPVKECVEMLCNLQRLDHIPARIVDNNVDCLVLTELVNAQVLSVCYYNDFEMHFIAQCVQVVSLIHTLDSKNPGESKYWWNSSNYRLDNTFCHVVEEMLFITIGYLEDAIDAGTSELEWQYHLMRNISRIHDMLKGILK